MQLRALIASVVWFLAIGTAAAQAWPTKAIRLVVPYPPGGGTDLVARSVAARVADALGQPIVVDNRGGAGGTIGTDIVAKAAPDGTLWFLTTLSHVVNPALSKSVPYHPTNDFTGVAMLGNVPALAVVHASVPAGTLRELVALARAQPGRLNYLNPGVGTSMHLNTELLKLTAGIDVVSVPYKGLAPGVPDLLAGTLSFSFLSLPLAAPHIKSGRIKALAIASPGRNPLFPDVPTIVEAGFPDAQVVSWYLVSVHAKTPRDIVARINDEVNKALADPEVVKRLEAAGASIAPPSTPADTDALLRSETLRWAKFARDAKIEAQ